jgi:hypothetical protein
MECAILLPGSWHSYEGAPPWEADLPRFGGVRKTGALRPLFDFLSQLETKSEVSGADNDQTDQQR